MRIPQQVMSVYETEFKEKPHHNYICLVNGVQLLVSVRQQENFFIALSPAGVQHVAIEDLNQRGKISKLFKKMFEPLVVERYLVLSSYNSPEIFALFHRGEITLEYACRHVIDLELSTGFSLNWNQGEIGTSAIPLLFSASN